MTGRMIAPFKTMVAMGMLAIGFLLSPESVSAQCVTCDSYCTWGGGEGHLTFQGNHHTGSVWHSCNGSPGCSNHPSPCDPRETLRTNGVQWLIDQRAIRVFEKLPGDEIWRIVQRSVGLLEFNEERMSVQVLACNTPTQVALNLPMSPEQMDAFLRAEQQD